MHIASGVRTLTLVLAFFSSCCSAGFCAEFTNDETTYINANPKMVWGGVTNLLTADLAGNTERLELRSGINVKDGIIILSGQDSNAINPVRMCLENYSAPPSRGFSTRSDQGVLTTDVPSTNWAFVYLPPPRERFLMAMTDTNNVPVPKTSAGAALDSPSELNPSTTWQRIENSDHSRISLLPKGIDEVPFSNLIGEGIPMTRENVTQMWELNPFKYFELAESGVYRLTVAQRLYVLGTNSCLRPFTLPPVTVDVRVVNDKKR